MGTVICILHRRKLSLRKGKRKLFQGHACPGLELQLAAHHSGASVDPVWPGRGGGQEAGSTEVDEQYKRPDSSCSPEGNVLVWGSRWGWGERTVVVVGQKRGLGESLLGRKDCLEVPTSNGENFTLSF